MLQPNLSGGNSRELIFFSGIPRPSLEMAKEGLDSAGGVAKTDSVSVAFLGGILSICEEKNHSTIKRRRVE
jgi:hypothetical protein